MGEKKRRLATFGASKSSADAGLVRQQAFLDTECARIERVILARPEDHAALARLCSLRHSMSMFQRDGDVTSSTRNLNRALDAITRALLLQPAIDAYWAQFAECIVNASLEYPLAPQAREMLERALLHPVIHPQALVAPIVALVRSHPHVRAQPLMPARIDDGDTRNLLAHIEDVLGEPLLQKLMELCIVADPVIENLIVQLRMLVLRETVKSLSESSPVPVPVITAVAHQCFATEYVYDLSDVEEAALASLERAIQSRLDGNIEVPPHWIALFACYRPLHLLQGIAHVGIEPGATEHKLPVAPQLQSLLRSQVFEPAEERRLIATIPSAATSGNAVSAAVGALYESNPYPRWIKTVRLSAAGGLHEQLRQIIPHAKPMQAGDSRPAILIAGCGTGQHSIETAQRYRDARVLAIDLSLSSLAYARRKTEELGLDNVEYRQCDILDLPSLAERFDLIESIGVLHHLDDPVAGWRVLRELLKPNGIMRIGLYSEIARQELLPFMEMVATEGMSPDLPGIRRCRARVRAQFNDRPELSLKNSPDFYCASGCRDMLFHVMEHRYTLPKIGAMIDQLGLKFLGLHLPAPGLRERYLARFPDDPQLTDLDHWHQFETDHPWMFRGLYKVWVQAKG